MTELPAIDLTGFNPKFGCVEYNWGPPVPLSNGDPWQEHAFHIEALSWHYHDYMGTHLFVQVWDYRQQEHPDQRWQYMLLLHAPKRFRDEDGAIYRTEWAWTCRKEYESDWGERVWPTHAEVGADIDAWVTAPDELRFILE